MTERTYAIIPLRLESWTKGEILSADCYNDLHSSNNALSKILREDEFLAYEDNTFRFKITENSEYELPQDSRFCFSGHVLIDVSFFSHNSYRSRSYPEHLEINSVTARQLMQLVTRIYQNVS